MARSRISLTDAEFQRGIASCFGFLAARGFLGPEVGEFFAAFHRWSPELVVRIGFNDREGSVRTSVVVPSAVAGLPCLYVGLGLGSAQDIRRIARSEKHLGKVLESQAAAVLKVLGRVDDPHSISIIAGCHGR